MWQLTRTDNGEYLKLHAQFDWADEYDWTSLAQSQPVYTLTGAMHIQQGIKKAGRPITLNGENTRTPRHTLKVLQNWASVPELTLKLIHPDGREFSIVFDRPAIDNIKTKKNFCPKDQLDTDEFTIDLHFLTIL